MNELQLLFVLDFNLALMFIVQLLIAWTSPFLNGGFHQKYDLLLWSNAAYEGASKLTTYQEAVLTYLLC